MPIHEEFEIQSSDTGPLEKLVRQSDYSAVRKALNSLPTPQREVVVLVFYHQLSGPEVAQVLDITVGTVKSRLHRAKETLRRVLHAEGGLSF